MNPLKRASTVNQPQLYTTRDTQPTKEPTKPLQLKEKAYLQLKKFLIQGHLVPGTLLSERKLAVELHMSNTPVRSAIERLESEGFLSISPQQGILVRRIEPSELENLFQVRLALETHVIQKLCSRPPEDLDQSLKNSLSQLSEELANSPEALYHRESEFSLLPAKLLGNDEITKILSSIGGRILQATLLIAKSQNGSFPTDAFKPNEDLLNAIANGDEASALSSIVQNLSNKKALLVSALNSQASLN